MFWRPLLILKIPDALPEYLEMNDTKKTKRLLIWVRLKNVVIFLILFLLVAWLVKLIYGQMGGSSDFWSFIDGLSE